ncbi:MAG: SNF2 family N-terminal domain-containing protein [Benjaminiella poitrasii]|nr:MAG: SNF2 family N-terminal domain-containing protein [Benjaminiella poitrasii]
MAFDQPNQSSHRQQAHSEQASSDVSLPPITTDEWEYNRYTPGSITNRNYAPHTSYPSRSPQPSNYATHDNYNNSTYSQAPSWEQNPRQYSPPTREYTAPYPSQPTQPSNTLYDPVRSNYSAAPVTETLSPPQDRNQSSISPVMSISQLLSSDNSEQKATYSPTESAVAAPALPPSSPTFAAFDPIERRNNGIQNLLNSDSEDKYQMADSDTDTEDIPLIRSPKIGSTTIVTETINPIVSNTNNTTVIHENNYDTDSTVDEISEDDMRPKPKKPITKRTREELALSDEGDEEDDDILLAHREEMIQFMVEVHKRRKRVIEEYEKKEARKHAKMKDRIEQIYEKKYGTRMPSSDVFRKKYKLNRQSKKLKLLQTQKQTDDDESTDTEINFGTEEDGKSRAERKLEDERRKIWLTIARKDIPRMTRILSRVQATRSGNCKKIAQYCQKEVRRAATNGGRANRDLQNKAKRASKEMLLFWKKNEKEERELRKKAEKEALDRLKQEEERREAQRQARKLNFLITQTELYSHFIGRKIKQDTEEDEETAQPAPSGLSTPLAPVASSDELDDNAGITNIGEVNFDEEDEAVLKEKARLSAQNALAKQREKTREFDQGARERRIAAGDSVPVNEMSIDDMNFQEPSSMGSGPEVTQPNMLMCQLKSYQLKGLNWLANLYEQGINGILADEMGLGKTVQSISLLAYLAEVHNIWGPFLVIAPASTLHNWQQEFAKFVPQFRALPYWGNPKDRKVLRQFWNRKQLYGKDAPFHIVITSYQLVLTDVTYFQRVKWQYMILDEAQAIKSSSSARWKQLLGFHCRNRLLLTGTPIQNSMQELWALLHFIMPTLFDSHEEFSEWFSKDIESHAENRGSLNQHQLRRLHMILKPFMLRRIKRNVQHELGEKIEIELFCDLTARQKALYRGLKEKISISELLEKATSLGDIENMDSLMNLVMQFRKVCNHPELFERADVMSPLSFCNFSETGSLTKETNLYCPYSASSHIKYHIPKKLYRNGGFLKIVSADTDAGFRTKYLDNIMNIWNSKYIYDSEFSNEADSAFSFLRFCDMTPHEASYLFRATLVEKWMDHLARRDQRARRKVFTDYPQSAINTSALFLITETNNPLSVLTLTPGSPFDELTHVSDKFIQDTHTYGQCYLPAVNTVPVDIICDDASFIHEKQNYMFDINIRSCFFGTPSYVTKTMPEEQANLSAVVQKTDSGIMTVPASGNGFSWMKVPSMKDLILDSGKLATLDKLLEKLKTEGHRCLIYFQMTRMIDLFEEYIGYKQYRYLRLDGSSKISDRRDMVQDWQTRPEIFIFLLSTRAGGLGINLTAADTVIFYDSDWNPTVDQQAMDRAHRLGQTKQVTVYRLITKGTIEERILQRAKQKDEIQKVVISGGEFRQVDFKPREIVSLLLDDEELDDKLQLQLKRKAEEEEEQKKAPRPVKRSRKQTVAANGGSKESTPALSPSNVDRLFSAGEDIINTGTDEDTSGTSTPAKKTKSNRIGRPRTNFSFTG